MSRRLSAVIAAAALTLVAAPAVAAHAEDSTTYIWVGSSQDSNADNHSWTDQRNWTPNGIPSDGDSVVIAPPDAGHCTATVNGVPTVSLADLTLTQPPLLCGASITGGAITVTGSFAWDGGSLATPLTLAPGSSGTVSAANDHQNTLSQPMTVEGALTLANLTNHGVLFFSNFGQLGITVAAGGTLHSSGATELKALSCCGAPATITNNGTLQVDSGRLHASAIEVDQNGTLFVAHSATLDSDGGVVTASTGAHYTGAGTWTIEDGATARMNGAQNLGTQFHLQLGTIGATSAAKMGGRFTLRGTGTFDWSGGLLGGSVTVASTAHVHVFGVTINNGRRMFTATDATSGSPTPSQLTNHGTIKFDDGAVVTQSAGTTWTNSADGVVTLAAGTTLGGSGCCLAAAVLANNGGRVNIGTGSDPAPATLPLMSVQDAAGTVSIASGQSVQLAHGPRHSLTDTQVIGGGTLQVAGATTVAGDVDLVGGSMIELASGGSLDGTATVDGGGALAWTGGSMSGNVTLAPEDGTSVSGTVAKSVAVGPGNTPSTVDVQTALTFAPGTSSAHDLLELGSSSLVLDGRTTVPAFVEIHAGSLTNNGTMTVKPGAEHADRTGPTETTVNTGTISVVSGTFALANTYQQNAGALAITATASGTGQVTVAHAATVAGTLHMINKAVPAPATARTVLTTGGLTWTGSLTTTGKGTQVGHWVATHSATALTVHWHAT